MSATDAEQKLQDASINLAGAIHEAMPHLEPGAALERCLMASMNGYFAHYGKTSIKNMKMGIIMFLNGVFAAQRKHPKGNFETDMRETIAEAILFGPRGHVGDIDHQTQTSPQKDAS